MKWLITEQTASSVSGTVTANCASGVNVAANLTGTMQSQDVINLVATGTLTAMGLPCQFNLNGTGTRQAGDTMKVDYNGSYCLERSSGRNLAQVSKYLRKTQGLSPVPSENLALPVWNNANCPVRQSHRPPCSRVRESLGVEAS